MNYIVYQSMGYKNLWIYYKYTFLCCANMSGFCGTMLRATDFRRRDSGFKLPCISFLGIKDTIQSNWILRNRLLFSLSHLMRSNYPDRGSYIFFARNKLAHFWSNKLIVGWSTTRRCSSVIVRLPSVRRNRVRILVRSCTAQTLSIASIAALFCLLVFHAPYFVNIYDICGRLLFLVI